MSAYEMGLKPQEVKRLTLKEFNLMYTGYFRREEREWNRTRLLMTYILNYAGMGATQFKQPQEVWPLDMDKKFIRPKIKTIAQAMRLLKEYHGIRISD